MTNAPFFFLIRLIKDAFFLDNIRFSGSSFRWYLRFGKVYLFFLLDESWRAQVLVLEYTEDAAEYPRKIPGFSRDGVEMRARLGTVTV